NAALQTARNDSMLAVAEAYFNVQQARGNLAGAEDVERRTEDLVRRTRRLALAVVPELEVVRARGQARRRRQAVPTPPGRWGVAGAELNRVWRLDYCSIAEPVEPPHMQVTLIGLNQPVEELIAQGLTNRPELASQQSLVQATVARIRQEKLRPFIPSLMVRG